MDKRTRRVGRYEAIRPIASGGMATVYLGRAAGDAGFSRTVALKVMHPHLAGDEDFVEMFLNEAHLAANLRHPNVVTTLDVARSEEDLFLVMEYIEGLTAQVIQRTLKKQGKRLPHNIAVRIALDTLAGLSAAHELKDAEGRPQGLIHRDVSPQNIIVGVAGIARLVDFGIARAQSQATGGKGVKGKLSYMSPEQARADAIDARADVYGAGIVLWELLTGERLFQADNDAGLLGLVVQGPTRTPRQLDPTIPPAIDAVCMRALAVSPAGRFSSAAEFAEALEDAAERTTGIATPRAVASLLKEIARARETGSLTRSRDDDSRPSAATPGSQPSATGSGATSAAHAMISTGVTARRKRSLKRAVGASAIVGIAAGGLLALLTSGPGGDGGTPAASVGEATRLGASEPGSATQISAPPTLPTPTTPPPEVADPSPERDGESDTPTAKTDEGPKSAAPTSKPTKKKPPPAAPPPPPKVQPPKPPPDVTPPSQFRPGDL